MAESYAPGWTIEREGLSEADTVHVRVNGYANGWRIPWTGSYELTATYEPARPAELALYVDLVAVPLGLGALILWRRRRR